jgi:hypothetical protein
MMRHHGFHIPEKFVISIITLCPVRRTGVGPVTCASPLSYRRLSSCLILSLQFIALHQAASRRCRSAVPGGLTKLPCKDDLSLCYRQVDFESIVKQNQVRILADFQAALAGGQADGAGSVQAGRGPHLRHWTAR